MERLECDRYGGPEVLRLAPFALDPPRATDVPVLVAAASPNSMDWKIPNRDMTSKATSSSSSSAVASTSR